MEELLLIDAVESNFILVNLLAIDNKLSFLVSNLKFTFDTNASTTFNMLSSPKVFVMKRSKYKDTVIHLNTADNITNVNRKHY